MKAPFKLPASFSEQWETISDATGQTIANHECGCVTPEAIAFTVYAINTHDALVEFYEASKELDRLNERFGANGKQRMLARHRLEAAIRAVECVL